MKKHLLLNQLFGTEGSPNQTGETLTRENRIGLMSYLRRTLMLLFAVLVMSVANIGMAWGGTITWDFGSETSTFTKGTAKDFTGSDGSTILTYKAPDGDSFDGDAPNKYLKMGGASKVSSNIYNVRYFELTAPSKAGTISITYAADNATNASIHTNTNNGVLRTTITATASTKCTSSTIGGLVVGTTKIQIAFPSKAYIKAVEWNDVDAPTRSYYSVVKTTLETGASLSLSPSACANQGSAGSGLYSDFANYYSLTNKAGELTITPSSAIALNSNGSNRGCIRIYYGGQPFSLKVNGVATGSSYTVYNSTYINVAEYTIPNGTTSLSSFTMVGTGSSTGGKFYAVEVLTWPAASCEELAAPTGLACVDQSYNTLSFSWDAVANASSYDVKLWTNSTCTGDPVKNANTSNTTCRIRDLDPATTYYCKVQTKGDGSTYCTSGGITATAVSATTDSGTRTFKSGETVFFKDADDNIGTINRLWVIDGGNVYAYFYNSNTDNNWASGAGTVVRESHHYGNAIYSFTVPKNSSGNDHEWSYVIFTRGTAATWESGYWNETQSQSPEQGKNMFTISKENPDGSSHYKGSWSVYANGAAIYGDMNNWVPDGGEFYYGGGSIGTVYMNLAANTEYKFKVLDGTGAKGCPGTITNTTTSWWGFAEGDEDCTIRTGEEGSYAFKWDNAGTPKKTLGVYYPQARFAKNKYIYFDASNLSSSNWNKDPFSVKFVFKPYDNKTYEKYSVESSYSNVLEDHVYYAVVPDDDYLGFVRVDRWSTNFSGSRWNYADDAVASDRTSSKQNCMITKDADKAAWDGLDQEWTTYCPPMSSSTLSDNSTVVIAGTSGDGTVGRPYLVNTNGSILVRASATKAVNDPNMTINYDFKVNDESQQAGTGNTYTHSSLTNNTTYEVSMDSYNTYNGATGTKNTSAGHIYYKALNVYTVSYNKGDDGTGSAPSNDAKIYGIALTLPDAAFTRTGYTQDGWSVNANGSTKDYELNGSYTANEDDVLYPHWQINNHNITYSQTGHKKS